MAVLGDNDTYNDARSAVPILREPFATRVYVQGSDPVRISMAIASGLRQTHACRGTYKDRPQHAEDPTHPGG